MPHGLVSKIRAMAGSPQFTLLNLPTPFVPASRLFQVQDWTTLLYILCRFDDSVSLFTRHRSPGEGSAGPSELYK